MRRRQLVIKQTLFRVQRQLVLHIAREYRIVSHATATVGPLTFWLENRPFTYDSVAWRVTNDGGGSEVLHYGGMAVPPLGRATYRQSNHRGHCILSPRLNRQRMAGWPTSWHRCLLVTNVSVNIYVLLKSYHCVVHLDTLASSIP